MCPTEGLFNYPLLEIGSASFRCSLQGPGPDHDALPSFSLSWKGQVQAPQELFSVNIFDRPMKTSDHLFMNDLFCSQSFPWFQPS